MLIDQLDDGPAQRRQAHAGGDDHRQHQPQPPGQRGLEACIVAGGVELRQGGQHRQRDRHRHRPQRQLDEERGLVHVGDRLGDGARGQVAIDDHAHVLHDDAEHHRRIEHQQPADHAVSPVEAEAQAHAFEPRKLHHELRDGGHHDRQAQRWHAQPRRQQQHGHDDAQIVRWRAERRIGKALARIVKGLQDAREPIDQDRRHDQADEQGGGGQQLGVKAAHQRRGNPRCADLEQQHHDQQHRRPQSKEHREHVIALTFLLRGGVLAEHGDQRRREHAAHQQLVHHLGDGADGVKGAGGARGAKRAGDDRLAHQPEQAAGDVARRVDGRVARYRPGARRPRRRNVDARVDAGCLRHDAVDRMSPSAANTASRSAMLQ